MLVVKDINELSVGLKCHKVINAGAHLQPPKANKIATFRYVVVSQNYYINVLFYK